MQVSGYLCALIACIGLTLSVPTGNQTRLESGNDAPPLLLVSFDGFRADYLKKYSFPNLEKFFSEGVLVRELTNVFTTKTFPNHYSLVTGLYAESHGILASIMYDPVSKKTFSIQNDSDPFWWNEATPIWVSVEESGYKAAAAMWPGTDVNIQNHTLKYQFEYDPKVTFQDRLGNLTQWMTTDKSVKFAALYWEEPDRSGHMYGPENTTEMSRVLKEVDGHIGFLMEQLNKTGLWGKINVIITSDHGMAQCSQEHLIKLDGCISPSSYRVVDLTPVAAIIPLEVNEQCGELALAVGLVIGVLIILTTFTCLFKLMKNRDASSSRPFARLELEDDADDEPLLE
ncbi:bis(5'-adenosyl)-triphosphatase enpp4-like [Sinocyclocheilus grahami]|uniref:bis(5'-adenosyl)-triphosphatase enpp4-like n=1 Tax=Sinocyclocheilus grahami TaxID=75366 RepID=UPI0007AD5729|nr:PREDICTED: bis(5'-adenosyl)-triphosphatase enpp4-like [Sinocyclocheilus grahami]